MLNSSKKYGSSRFARGATPTEIAIVAALVGIIAFALVMTIRDAIGGGKGTKIARPKSYRVKCIKCGKEWDIKPEELPLYQRREEMSRRRRGSFLHPFGGDCPYCHSKGTVFVMRQCPNCGKYYLPARIKDPAGYAEGKVRDVCPYCGTDLKKWWKEHLKR